MTQRSINDLLAASLAELSEWMRQHTSAADGTRDMLAKATAALAMHRERVSNRSPEEHSAEVMADVEHRRHEDDRRVIDEFMRDSDWQKNCLVSGGVNGRGDWWGTPVAHRIADELEAKYTIDFWPKDLVDTIERVAVANGVRPGVMGRHRPSEQIGYLLQHGVTEAEIRKSARLGDDGHNSPGADPSIGPTYGR